MNNILKICNQLFLYNAEYTNVSLAIILLILGFAGYHYVSLFLKDRLNRWKKLEITFTSTIVQRLTGFVFFGLIPLIIFTSIRNISFQKYGFNIQNLDQSFIWLGIFIPLILLINYFMASKEINLQNYPQIRIKNWSTKFLIINFITWLIYLFAYEAFFRGFLLYSFYYTFGISTSIVVNIILYAMAHLPKGSREMIGSIPFGLVLCMITINTGSFLPAFLIHGIMAISYEFFSIKAHPEMSIKNKSL
ncbi:hypothetical protein AKJ55_00490 [candidate division MSBL1 archaeon SCGC-AAA382M17]|uniref:CAAX prenyl protease 2/Lysostaphin resistance protein A-like domain-containing protein n=1 Tax=candidate division MSBL1 archaeon SCGC-AAA382M17 TaxID=1698284 RepID=A0ABR5TJX5_9EURY|nr:hypothetical protein AKJ55_00490 [candidate division MSBL1 archaeon SCGC-AAA382M17]